VARLMLPTDAMMIRLITMQHIARLRPDARDYELLGDTSDIMAW
jgi:hypothetical protein